MTPEPQDILHLIQGLRAGLEAETARRYIHAAQPVGPEAQVEMATRLALYRRANATGPVLASAEERLAQHPGQAGTDGTTADLSSKTIARMLAASDGCVANPDGQSPATLKQVHALLAAGRADEVPPMIDTLAPDDARKARVATVLRSGDALGAWRHEQDLTGLAAASLTLRAPKSALPEAPAPDRHSPEILAGYIDSLTRLDALGEAVAFGLRCMPLLTRSYTLTFAVLSALTTWFPLYRSMLPARIRPEIRRGLKALELLQSDTLSATSGIDQEQFFKTEPIDQTFLEQIQTTFPITPEILAQADLDPGSDIVPAADPNSVPFDVWERACAARGFTLRDSRTARLPNPGPFDALLDRASLGRGMKALLDEMQDSDQGVIVLSSHHGALGRISALPLAALVDLGVPGYSYVRGPSTSQPHANNAPLAKKTWTASSGASFFQVERSASSTEAQIALFLRMLRKGHAAMFALDVPRVLAQTKAWVPWFLRPVFLPVFPASTALSAKARFVYALAWQDADGTIKVDAEPIETPPDQGSVEVRAIWATQRYARAALVAHRRTHAPLMSHAVFNSGGTPALSNRSRRANNSNQRLSDWIWDQESGAADQAALLHEGNSLARSELADYAKRLAQMFLDAQDEAPAHHAPDRRFSQQMRVSALVSKGATALAVGLAADATGTLLMMQQPDVAPAVMADRLATFRPHLVIAEASAWTQILAQNSALAKIPVLICEDGAGRPALKDITQGILPCPSPQEAGGGHAGDPGFVVFTSGSSGTPKGIVVPAGVHSGSGGFDRLNLANPRDTVAYTTRWDAVGYLDLLACLRGKMTIALADDGLLSNPLGLRAWLKETKVDVLSAPVTIWRYLEKAAAPGREDRLKSGVIWGEPLTRSAFRQIQNAFPTVAFHATLGASENSYISIGRISEQSFGKIKGSPGGTLIADRQVSLDQTGRMSVTSPAALVGSLTDLMATDMPVPVNNWPYTAHNLDAATIHPDGTVDVTGRGDEIIKVAGQRFALEDIETEMADIAPGARAVMFLAPDEDGGQALSMALEVPTGIPKQSGQSDVDAIRAYWQNTPFASARLVKIEIFASFPHMASGKLDKTRLKARLAESGQGDANIAPQVPHHSPKEKDQGADKLAQWCMSRHFQENDYDPARELPVFSSIDLMELHLLAEEVRAEPSARPLVLTNARTWSDLAALIRHTT